MRSPNAEIAGNLKSQNVCSVSMLPWPSHFMFQSQIFYLKNGTIYIYITSRILQCANKIPPIMEVYDRRNYHFLQYSLQLKSNFPGFLLILRCPMRKTLLVFTDINPPLLLDTQRRLLSLLARCHMNCSSQ